MACSQSGSLWISVYYDINETPGLSNERAECNHNTQGKSYKDDAWQGFMELAQHT